MSDKTRVRRFLALSAAVLAASAGMRHAAAATLDWDVTPGTVGAGDGAVTGGAGTWDTASGNWTLDLGANNVAWVNANGDTARFGAPGGTVTLGAPIVAGGLTFDAGGYTIGNGGTAANTLSLNAGSTITVANAADTATISAALTGSATGGVAGANTAATTAFVKAGAGTLTLTGANAFPGDVVVNAGGLTVANSGALSSFNPTGGGLATAPATRVILNGSTAVLTLNAGYDANNGATYDEFLVGTGGGTLSLPAGQTLLLNDAGQFGDGPAGLAPTAASVFTKAGAGTLQLNGTYAATFQTVVSDGRIQVDGGNSLGSGTNAVTINGTGALDLRATLTGAKPITVSGSGIGGAGALVSGGTGAASGPVTLAGDASLGGSGNLTLSGVVSDGAGTFGVTKVGAGFLALTGANAYDGPTLVSAGTLRGASGTGLPNTSNLTLNGGAFESTAATFSRALGTAAGQVQLTGGASGFGAQANNAAVTVNLGGAAAGVQWGSATFNPSALVLNQATANNVITFANPLDLNGADRTVTVNAPLGNNIATISGVVSNSTGTAGLTKTGTGVLSLTAANTYAGTTTVSSGVLRAGSGTGLPTASNLTLSGGAFETAAGLTRALGSGANQVQLTGGASGFSANGAAITVNLGGAAAQVQWGSANFNPTVLVLNESTANNTLNFQNPIDLNGATRTVAANANVATISGAITGAGGFTKQGGGVLALTAAGNAYTGTTTVAGGALRATDGSTLPGTNLTLNGGAFETGVPFTRALGTGASEVQLTGGASGFSANGAPIAVNLGGAAAPVTWGGATFNPSALVLNAGSANNTLDFQNPLNLNGATRTVQANANAATVSGVISNGGAAAAGLTKTGNGVLVLSNANTYNGTTTISAGTLSVSTADNLGPITNPLAISGGLLRVTGTAMTSLSGRPLTLTGAVGFDVADPANNFAVTQAAALNVTGFTKTGPGTLALSLPATGNAINGVLNMNGGTLDIGAAALSINAGGGNTIRGTANSTINATGGGSITISTAGGTNFGDNSVSAGVTLTINAKLTSPAGGQGFEYCCDNPGGTIVLNNPANDFAGGVLYSSAGTISVPSIGNTGSTGPLGTGATINFNSAGARLLYTGGGESNNRTLAVTQSAILEQAGTGTLNFTTNVGGGTGNRTLTLQGSTSGIGRLSGTIPAGLAITKAGTGTWVLGGTSASAAATTVNAGTLLVDNATGSATGTGAVTVNSTGTLGGSGIIAGPVSVASGGTLSPGTSPGILSIGNLTMAAGATLREELGGTAAGAAGYDQVNVTGTVALGGATLALVELTQPAIGDTFVIVNNDLADAVTGTFAGLADEAVVNGAYNQYRISYDGATTGGNDVVLTALTSNPVPEPAALGLLGLAAGALLRRRRRA